MHLEQSCIGRLDFLKLVHRHFAHTHSMFRWPAAVVGRTLRSHLFSCRRTSFFFAAVLAFSFMELFRTLTLRGSVTVVCSAVFISLVWVYVYAVALVWALPTTLPSRCVSLFHFDALYLAMWRCSQWYNHCAQSFLCEAVRERPVGSSLGCKCVCDASLSCRWKFLYCFGRPPPFSLIGSRVAACIIC